MHASHGSVIVQDHGSASVWGMPQAALETGCTDLVLTISQIAPLLVSLVRDGYPLAAMQASGALGYGGAMAPKQDVALRHLLKTALRMQGTDLGNIQLVDPLTGDLVIAAQCGFGIDFLTHFRTVTPDEGSACARAFRDRATVFIEDVHAEPAFAPHRDIARAAGFCSVQSTPLISRAGSLLGVLSTHYRAPHRLPRTTIRNLRQLARCYVDIFESGHLDRPAAIEPFRPTPWV